jgi:hypothetical protein
MLDDPDIVQTPAVAALIVRGRDKGIPYRYLCSVRDPWYLVERIDPAHILVAIMSRSALRVVRNVVHAAHANSMHGIYCKNAKLAKPLAGWLSSDEGQAAMLEQARHYSDGLKKLEPRDLARVLVPTEDALTHAQD